ncbi:Qa-SNARE 4 [Giardia muris]|uniref:Qa-SNARE 4 n=1 Tax=Giardia muris TaxID=5742 RepID=A0A4Z1SX35_GIAMU|nr:Qa-SNARE 4 [Giardia muris]|eukprot:TNJ26273.1 Qa-SNARE 4 [Giardia muris]
MKSSIAAFHELLGVTPALPVGSPSDLHRAFGAVRNEIQALNRVISDNTGNYIVAPLALGTYAITPTWFTDEECVRFDARVMGTLRHITGLIEQASAILREYKTKSFTHHELLDAGDDLLGVLEAQLRREQSHSAIHFFEGVEKALYEQSRQVLSRFSRLKAARSIRTCSTDDLKRKSIQLSRQVRAPISHNNEEEQMSPLTGVWADLDVRNRHSQVGQTQALVQEVLPSLLEEAELARQTEQTALEIQAIGNVFAEKVYEQSEQITRIHSLTFETVGTLESANTYLQRAARRLRGTTKLTVVIIIMAIFSLIFLDRING